MKLGILPEGPLERVALATGAVPTPLLEGVWGMFTARCLLVATRLGVFDALADGPKSAEQVASSVNAHPQGVEPLLRALNGFGYLRRRAGRYTLTSSSRRWLTRASGWSMRDAILFLELLGRWMDRLEAGVKTGEASRIHEAPLADEDWERYLRGLATFARVAAREVVRRVRLSRAPARLLDVGGGHGEYSAAFCRRYPGLTAEVLDLPGAVEQGRRIVAEAGLADRVRCREGDMRTAEWGEGYDVVLIFNVLHNATEPEAQQLMRKAFAALRPGATLAILESAYRQTSGDLDAASGFGELFFFFVSGARTYPEATMRGWMTAAGFEKLRASHLLFAPAVLLTARRP